MYISRDIYRERETSERRSKIKNLMEMRESLYTSEYRADTRDALFLFEAVWSHPIDVLIFVLIFFFCGPVSTGRHMCVCVIRKAKRCGLIQ